MVFLSFSCKEEKELIDTVWNRGGRNLTRQVNCGEKKHLQTEFYQENRKGEGLTLGTEGRLSERTSLPDIHIWEA